MTPLSGSNDMLPRKLSGVSLGLGSSCREPRCQRNAIGCPPCHSESKLPGVQTLKEEDASWRVGLSKLQPSGQILLTCLCK